MDDMITFVTIEGYFNETDARRIVQLTAGKTFYDFKVSYGYDGCNCNCVLCVGSEYRDQYGKLITKEELKDTFLWYALTLLAEKN